MYHPSVQRLGLNALTPCLLYSRVVAAPRLSDRSSRLQLPTVLTDLLTHAFLTASVLCFLGSSLKQMVHTQPVLMDPLVLAVFFCMIIHSQFTVVLWCRIKLNKQWL